LAVDYTLCGALSAWEKRRAETPDHAPDDLFIVTMRIGSNGRILGQS
jgi:hypothetical protein